MFLFLRVVVEEAPADFILPITTEVTSDPVMAADGHAFQPTKANDVPSFTGGKHKTFTALTISLELFGIET